MVFTDAEWSAYIEPSPRRASPTTGIGNSLPMQEEKQAQQ
jgi:hypothetical protein